MLQLAQPTRPKSDKLSGNIDINDCEAYEYQQFQSVTGVKGRLAKNIEFWRNIGANDYVLNLIEFGYKLPMSTVPPKSRLKNNKSALAHVDFVTKAINDLVLSGAVKEVSQVPHVVNPLTVAKNKGNKLRLVLDLRFVNPYVELDHIKFDDWSVASDYLVHNGYMFSFDLKSGYHHIDIHPSFQRYLGFSWQVDNHVHYYTFTVLPFGLRTAGHVFTKTLRCLVKHWRSQSVRAVVYLDDGLFIESTYALAKMHSDLVRKDLFDSGLVENIEKSIWEPVQILIWLGIQVDLTEGTLSIPEKRVSSVLDMLRALLNRPRTTARILAGLAGKISSTRMVLGSATRLMLRDVHRVIMERSTWDAYFNLNDRVICELQFWLK